MIPTVAYPQHLATESGPIAPNLFEVEEIFLPTSLPEATATICSIDQGRVSLRDAIRELGWSKSTPLDFTLTDRAVTIMPVAKSAQKIQLSQGRCLLPLSIRRRMGWLEGSKLFVVTYQSPTEHVRLYDIADVVKLLSAQLVMP